MAKVAVLGAGTMGHALALVFALGAHSVRLTDNDPRALDQAGTLMEAALRVLVEAGEADVGWTTERLRSAVTRCMTLEHAVDGAELIVEAIIERRDAKCALYAQVDAVAPEDAILASNTSYLDIFPLVPKRRQRRTLIAHWYTPPYLIDLVDVVGSDKTDPAVIAQVRDMVSAMGKAPVVLKRFIPGYIANRIQSAIALEVNRLLDEGYANPKDIDDAVIHGLALRIPIVGALMKADFTGLGLTRDALANRTYEPPPVRSTSETLEKLLVEGRSGVLSGKGYFDWGGRTPEELFRERDGKLLALKRALREIGPMQGK
jgi:3-hydroxybutyryl-CoA dehydrogenase